MYVRILNFSILNYNSKLASATESSSLIPLVLSQSQPATISSTGTMTTTVLQNHAHSSYSPASPSLDSKVMLVL